MGRDAAGRHTIRSLRSAKFALVKANSAPTRAVILRTSPLWRRIGLAGFHSNRGHPGVSAARRGWTVLAGWLAPAPAGRWVGSWDCWRACLCPNTSPSGTRVESGAAAYSYPFTATAREWCDRAKKTLKDTGARNISSASEAAADYGTTDKPTERAPAADTNRGEAPAKQAAKHVAHETKK